MLSIQSIFVRAVTKVAAALVYTVVGVTVALAQGGSVGGGGRTPPAFPQPNGVTAVYVYSFTDTPNGPVSISLLHDDGTGSVHVDANGNGYVTVDADGDVNVSGLYESYCPTPDSHIYMVVLGSTVGTTYNSAVAEIAFMPTTCSQFDNLPGYDINETTTAAAAYGIAKAGLRLTPTLNNIVIDSLSGPVAGKQTLDNAFNYAANFVDATSGNILTQTPSGGATVPSATVGSISNMLSACTLWAGQSSGTNCSSLFSASATQSWTPVDTLQAAVDIANNPTANVATLYSISLAQPQFQPALSSQPADWTLPLTFAGSLATNILVGDVKNSTVNVAVEDANGVPTSGTVACSVQDANNNITSLGTSTLVYGGSQLTLPSLPPGTSTLTCNYTPSGSFQSSSVAQPLISGKNYTSQVLVNPTPNPTNVNQGFTVNATVELLQGTTVTNIQAQGTVTCTSTSPSTYVFSGQSSQLTNNVASIVFPAPTTTDNIGISCEFVNSSTGSNRASSSPQAYGTESVVYPSSSPTMTSVNLASAQIYGGTSAVATITVSDSLNVYPDGTVSCIATGTTQTLPPTTLSNGSANWTLTGLPVGTYDLSCSYSGSSTFLASNSAAVQLQVIAALQPTWVQDGNMSTPRAGHTATLLNDGTVLLAGGLNTTQFCSVDNRVCEPFTIQSSGEIYNPSAGTVTAVSNSMQTPRQGATSTLLNNGQVLITGGGQQRYFGSIPSFPITATADLYNPSVGQFAPTGNMAYARCSSTATKLLDGRVLIIGGSIAPAEIYDPNTGTFSTTGTPTTGRMSGFTATLLQNGKVLVTGGSTDLSCVSTTSQTVNVTAAAEIYDPNTGTFTAVPNMNVARMMQTATLLSTGQVLIVGGTTDLQNALSSAELYDPVANTFTLSNGTLNSARAGHTTNLLANGLILIAGGANPIGIDGASSRIDLNSAELYNPETDSFTPTVSMNTARSTSSPVVMPDGSLLETGGAGTAGALQSMEAYAPPTVTGWVNPKYVIVGVSYAPPGSASTVSYANSITQGNTTTLSDSYSNGNSLAVSISNTIKGAFFLSGGITYTASSTSSFTQGSMSSNAVTLTKMSTLTEAPQAVVDPNNPVNHEYDVVYLWINPLAVFTATPTNPGPVVWNGYAYDPNDVNGQDIVPVLVGQLIGDLPMDQGTMTALSRTWATNQVFPAGESAAISAQDMLTIAQADPFVDCNYDNGSQSFTSCSFPSYNTAGSNFGPPLPANSADGRFTQVTDASGNFIPPFSYGPGLPKTTFSAQTTNTTVATQQSNHSFTQAFGIDVGFQLGANLGFFASNMKIDTKYNQTLTWTHTYQQALTDTTSNTSTVTISPPSCSGSSCSSYAGPPEFVLYQDNLYGTFMFYPLH